MEHPQGKKISWSTLLQCLFITGSLLYLSLLALKLDHQEFLAPARYSYIGIFLGVSMISAQVIMNGGLSKMLMNVPTFFAVIMFIMTNLLGLLLLVFLGLVHLKLDNIINISYDYIFIVIYPAFFFYLVVFCFALPGFMHEDELQWKSLSLSVIYSVSFIQLTITLNFRLSGAENEEPYIVSVFACLGGLLGAFCLNFLFDIHEYFIQKKAKTCRAARKCGTLACFIISLSMTAANMDQRAQLPWKLIIGFLSAGITAFLYGLMDQGEAKIEEPSSNLPSEIKYQNFKKQI